MNYTQLKKKTIILSLLLRTGALCFSLLDYYAPIVSPVLQPIMTCICVIAWLFVLLVTHQLAASLYPDKKYWRKLLILFSDIFIPWLEIRGLFSSNLPTIPSLWQNDFFKSAVVFFENEISLPSENDLTQELGKRGVTCSNAFSEGNKRVLEIRYGKDVLEATLTLTRMSILCDTNEGSGFDKGFPWKLIVDSDGRHFLYEGDIDDAWEDAESLAEKIISAIYILKEKEKNK